MVLESQVLSEAVLLLQNEGKLLTFPGARIRIKVFNEAVSGRYSLIDYQADPAYAGPPPHWHKETIELFFVLEGELTFQLGERTFTASAGASVLIPTGIVHKFSNPSAQSARFLIVVSPGGFEHYFEELEAAIRIAGGMPARETMVALFKRYDTYDPAELG